MTLVSTTKQNVTSSGIDRSALANELSSVVGADFVIEGLALEVFGRAPSLLVRPGCAAEAAKCLGLCSTADAAVVPAGLMTWLDVGNPLRRADVVLSLERMNSVVDYSPADLTATVQPGLALRDFNELLQRERQWLPLDPAGARSASLGAIAACRSAGPLRFGFGTIRDYVIGLGLAHADGSTSKSGGRVVKNVAGYDLNKLYVGSFGTLAVLTELTFKLRPLPEKSSTVIVSCPSADASMRAVALALGPEMQPASVYLLHGFPTTSNHSFAIRFVDNTRAVDHQVDVTAARLGRFCSVDLLSDTEAESLWADIANVDQSSQISVAVSVGLAAAMKSFNELIARQPDGVVAADLGTGVVRLGFVAGDDDAVAVLGQMRAAAESVGGFLIIEKAPLPVKSAIDAWGATGEANIKLMKSLKQKFDPRGILNPGRFVGGI